MKVIVVESEPIKHGAAYLGLLLRDQTGVKGMDTPCSQYRAGGRMVVLMGVVHLEVEEYCYQYADQ